MVRVRRESARPRTAVKHSGKRAPDQRKPDFPAGDSIESPAIELMNWNPFAACSRRRLASLGCFAPFAGSRQKVSLIVVVVATDFGN